jgi:DnaJ-class molecular chaperone
MSSTANINFSEGEFFAVRAAADILRDKKKRKLFPGAGGRNLSQRGRQPAFFILSFAAIFFKTNFLTVD